MSVGLLTTAEEAECTPGSDEDELDAATLSLPVTIPDSVFRESPSAADGVVISDLAGTLEDFSSDIGSIERDVSLLMATEDACSVSEFPTSRLNGITQDVKLSLVRSEDNNKLADATAPMLPASNNMAISQIEVFSPLSLN